MMDEIPSVAVIVVHTPDDMNTFTSIHGKPYFAFVALNPNIRVDGHSEQDVLTKIKMQILGHIDPKRISAKIVNMTFGEELLIEEVHNS